MGTVEGETDVKPLTVSHNYYINTNPKPVMYIMINDAEDLFKRIKELSVDFEDQTLIIHAIHRGDDLTNLLWEIVKIHKYIPAVSFDMGNITSIGLSFNSDKIMVFIRQQKLVKHTIEGAVEVDNEETYNKLSDCFSDFKFKVLRNEHKSYYSKEDFRYFTRM
jgi:hypothetical protein